MTVRPSHSRTLLRAAPWLVLGLALALMAAQRPVIVSAAHDQSSEQATAISSHPIAAQDAGGTQYTTYLPIMRKPSSLNWRLGVDVGFTTNYASFSSLKAGWYTDWAVRYQPPRPQGMDFVQTVRFHQAVSCADNDPRKYDRTLCPYTVPYAYTASWSPAVAADTAREERGMIWLIGNEMDRRDWCAVYAGSTCTFTDHQDEMLPEVYARAYHDYYTAIKAADPTARIAVGGVIQATAMRLRYLDMILDEYQKAYGVPMPVDIWNVHAFTLREVRGSWGADVPPGISDAVGWEDPGGNQHMSMTVFDENIRRFRQWMKDRGQQAKPLIVSEYGVLLANLPAENDPAQVQAYMLATFDYFLHTTDCNIGQPGDNCRLVQAWSWYTLDSDAYNPLTRLIDRNTGELTGTGRAFRDWSASHLGQLAR